MSEVAATRHARTGLRAAAFGYASIVLFIGTIGVWAAYAPLSGAVIAPAQFVAESNLKKVQHQTGGTVTQLNVREGDRVSKGDVLLQLDETLLRANLAILQRQIDEIIVRSARLTAERDQLTALTFPSALSDRANDPDIAQLWSAEAHLFAVRVAARAGVRAQLRKRIEQLRSEIEGLSEQRQAKIREAQLIQRELVGVRDLFKQNLIQVSRLSQLEREAASLEGQRGQLTAGLAQAEGKIAEIELQILQQAEDLRAETMKELRELQGRSGELEERLGAAQDQLRKSVVRAPVAGIVHQLSVHTIGGVLSSAEPVMMIVPTEDTLSLEAKVSPQDVDQIALGQPVVVRLHAFNQRTTPELRGTVARLPADVSREPQTGLTYFIVRIAVSANELSRLPTGSALAGMQAEAFFETGTRTPLQYLFKPVADQFAKAMRER